VKFVDSLYRTYLDRIPNATELNYAVELLASGTTHKALTAEFKLAASDKGS
jgi:Domain of unknown function (DUF4214)